MKQYEGRPLDFLDPTDRIVNYLAASVRDSSRKRKNDPKAAPLASKGGAVASAATGQKASEGTELWRRDHCPSGSRS